MEWNAKIVRYRIESRIAVYFEKNKEVILRIKKLEDARWSYSLSAWHLPNTKENRQRFKLENTILIFSWLIFIKYTIPNFLLMPW